MCIRLGTTTCSVWSGSKTTSKPMKASRRPWQVCLGDHQWKGQHCWWTCQWKNWRDANSLGRSAKKTLSRLRFLLHSSSFAQARWISAMSCWEYLTSSGVQKKGQECPWHHVLFESILTCGSCHTYLWIWYTCDLLQFENVSTCDCGQPETVHVSHRKPHLWAWYTCDCCCLNMFLYLWPSLTWVGSCVIK